MTIKEAFQKLANDLSASLRNPFFVGRTLHDDFADIADKIVDAGGSTVTVTPVVTEGTKIATITVDGTGKDLYAPETVVTQVVTEGTKIATINETDIYAPSSGGGIDYSTTEQDTGLKWIDNSAIYQITIDLGVFGNVTGQVVNIAHNISNLNVLVSAMCTGSKSGSRVPIPTTNANSYLALMNVAITDTNVIVMSSGSMKDYHGYITLMYTKSV